MGLPRVLSLKTNFHSCKSVIPLYNNNHGAGRGPATLADLRRTVQPSYSTGQAGTPRERQQIASVSQLAPGDHVCFPRKGGVYWHHGIVTKIESGAGCNASYSLLHYSNYTEAENADSWLQWLLRFGRGSKGLVRVDRMDLTKEPQTYRLAYHSLDCYHPAVVVQRALSQISLTNYNLLGENCEHLAVWAKSGELRSFQVENIRQLCYQLGPHVLTLTTTTAAASVGVVRKVSSRIQLAASDSLAAIIKLRQGLKDLMKQRVSQLVFSRALWRMLIRSACIVATSALLRLVSPNAPTCVAQPLVNSVGRSLGDAVADMVLPTSI